MISVQERDVMNLREWTELNRWVSELREPKDAAKRKALRYAKGVVADLLDAGNDLTLGEVEKAINTLQKQAPPTAIETCLLKRACHLSEWNLLRIKMVTFTAMKGEARWARGRTKGPQITVGL